MASTFQFAELFNCQTDITYQLSLMLIYYSTNVMADALFLIKSGIVTRLRLIWNCLCKVRYIGYWYNGMLMQQRFLLCLLLSILAATCNATAAESSGKKDRQTQQTHCGLLPNDWCLAPAGDPCGRHLNVAACRADLACYGMPYQGESFAACRLDARGFSSNCPTVGCTSTPPTAAGKNHE